MLVGIELSMTYSKMLSKKLKRKDKINGQHFKLNIKGHGQAEGEIWGFIFQSIQKQTMDRQEALEALLTKRNEPKDTRPYGNLLDKYIR